MPQDIVRSLRHLDVPWKTTAFHSRSCIDGIPPKIVSELMSSYDPGNDWSGVYPDSKLKRLTIKRRPPAGSTQHVDGKAYRRFRMVRTTVRKPSHRHVGIADRLDFFDVMLQRKLI